MIELLNIKLVRVNLSRILFTKSDHFKPERRNLWYHLTQEALANGNKIISSCALVDIFPKHNTFIFFTLSLLEIFYRSALDAFKLVRIYGAREEFRGYKLGEI